MREGGDYDADFAFVIDIARLVLEGFALGFVVGGLLVMIGVLL